MTKSDLCQECGKCCTCMVLPVVKPMQKAIMLDWLDTRGCKVIKETSDAMYVEIDNPCPHLLKSGNKFLCEIYNQRPEGCRIFDGSKYDWLECAWKNEETDMKKSVFITTIDEQFEKARTPGAKDKFPRKHREGISDDDNGDEREDPRIHQFIGGTQLAAGVAPVKAPWEMAKEAFLKKKAAKEGVSHEEAEKMHKKEVEEQRKSLRHLRFTNENGMLKSVQITTIEEEFQKARTPGAKDKRPRKKKSHESFDEVARRIGKLGTQASREQFEKDKEHYANTNIPSIKEYYERLSAKLPALPNSVKKAQASGKIGMRKFVGKQERKRQSKREHSRKMADKREDIQAYGFEMGED